MRKLQIKFPSQIRISGWDFGSSARAMNQAGGKDSLMTYESVSKTQADLEKVSKSTTERKSMSTKTSIKRIALVAVSALGFGMVTSVGAWAEADANEVTGIAVSAVAGNSNATGEAQSFTVKLDPVNTDDDEVYTLKIRVSSQPAGVNSVTLTVPLS